MIGVFVGKKIDIWPHLLGVIWFSKQQQSTFLRHSVLLLLLSQLKLSTSQLENWRIHN